MYNKIHAIDESIVENNNALLRHRYKREDHCQGSLLIYHEVIFYSATPHHLSVNRRT